MLVTNIKRGEVIDIGDVRIAIDIQGALKIKLYIDAPKAVTVHRVTVPAGVDRFDKENTWRNSPKQYSKPKS